MSTQSFPTGWLRATLLVVAILVAGSACGAAGAGIRNPAIVFLISEDPDNYQAHKTIPVFAEMLRQKYSFEAVALKSDGDLTAAHFPRLAELLPPADLLVVFCRRLPLPPAEMDLIKVHVKAGKPVVGIRTANHAFSPRVKVAEGHVGWPEFVADVLGCENRGYGPAAAGTDVAIAAGGHPILKGVPGKWHSKGNVYLVAPLLDKSATVLLTGTIPDKVEPIAWTRMAGQSRVFYTSLGYPDDFQTSQFQTLLVNGIHWALGRASP